MNTQVSIVEHKLAYLGLSLPASPKPSGNYLLLNQVDDFLYISGVTCKYNGELLYKGRVGKDLSVKEGYEAAKITTLNHLRLIKDYLGDFEKINKVVKVVGYVNCESNFADIPKVINGTSDLLIELFGKKGEHARCAVGVSSLPGNAAVETDMIVQLIK